MIRYARKEDAPRILQLIKDLAEYEKAPLEAKATLEQIEQSIFSDNPVAYCHVAEDDGLVVGISIWFLNYSTWVGKPGIYLEDLYVDPAYRGKGYGLAFLKELGIQIAVNDRVEPSDGGAEDQVHQTVPARLNLALGSW